MFLEIHALNLVVWKSMALYQELETSFPDVKLTLNPSTCYFRQHKSTSLHKPILDGIIGLNLFCIIYQKPNGSLVW